MLSPNEVGKETLIKKFLKGIFELRTPQPRYQSIWDVSIVFNYLRTLGANNELTLQVLTHKAVILAALVSAQRAQTLCCLDLSFLRKTNESFTFVIIDKLKQTRPGHVGMEIVFRKFQEEECICIYSDLDAYIDRTKDLRNNSKMLISYKKPHGPVATETISRWIKTVLAASGLNTKVFKAHSTRAAATSAASERSIPVQHILNTAGWSNAKTFARFYKKEVIISDNSFALSLLQH